VSADLGKIYLYLIATSMPGSPWFHFHTGIVVGAACSAGNQTDFQNQTKHFFQVVKKIDTGKLYGIPFDKITVNTIKVIRK
jgi:hypothetical protein